MTCKIWMRTRIIQHSSLEDLLVHRRAKWILLSWLLWMQRGFENRIISRRLTMKRHNILSISNQGGFFLSTWANTLCCCDIWLSLADSLHQSQTRHKWIYLDSKLLTCLLWADYFSLCRWRVKGNLIASCESNIIDGPVLKANLSSILLTWMLRQGKL